MVRVILNVLSVLGFVIGLISWLDSDQTKSISYDHRTEIVWRQTRFFPLKLIYEDSKDLKSNIAISKTLLTVWNGGKNVVKPDDVRVPLNVVFQPGRLYEAKILTQLSVVSDNFNLEKIKENEYSLHWKVFDPGMAVQIAFLHSGQLPQMSLTTTIGPQTSVKKYSGYGTGGNIGILFGVVAGFYIAFKFISTALGNIFSEKSEFFIKSSWIGLGSVYGVVLIAVTIWAIAVFASAYTGSLFSDSRSPLALELDY